MLLAKWLFPIATLCWLVVAIYQTLVMVVAPARLDWPLRRMWSGEGFRRTVLGLILLCAVGWGGTVLAESFGYTWPPIPTLLAAASVLLVVPALAATLYSALLYRRPSAPEPDRF